MVKIVWNISERQAVAEELVAVFAKNLNSPRRVALSYAQLVLPLERRRKMTDQTAHANKLWVEAARNRARRVVHADAAPVCRSPYCECPAGKCVNGLPDMRDGSFSPTPAPQPLQELVKSELGSALEHLIDLVVDRVLARVQSRLTTDKASAGTAVPTYDAAAARANAALRNAPSPQRAPRPGVLIIGLLGAQVTETIAAFPHLDITHMTGEEGLTRPALLRAHTVLMTKFINHSVQGKYRKAPNLHFCNGGVSELRRMLSEIGQGVKC
jgi:hypothetical protein